MRKWIPSDSRSFTILLGALAIILVMFIVIYPDQIFKSSLHGLTIWWTFVFPGLLPFLILSEIMIGLGLVHALGTLLEPVMKLVFRLPGASGWALAMGLTAGFPAGADVTGQLRREGVLNASEAQRLLAVSHLCSPVIMIAVVGVGFLQSPEAGFMIAVVHYLSALAMGITLRWTDSSGRTSVPSGSSTETAGRNHGWLRRTAESLRSAHRKDGRTFGKLLGDSVTSAAQKLLGIGGYIILFSVLHRILVLALGPIVSAEPVNTLLSAFLEPHLGMYGMSRLSFPLLMTVAVIGAILGWSGLSLHAQARSLAGNNGIRYSRFILARLLHGAYAFILTVLLWKPLTATFGVVGTFAMTDTLVSPPNAAGSLLSDAGAFWTQGLKLWPLLAKLYVFVAGIFVLLICISLINRAYRKKTG